MVLLIFCSASAATEGGRGRRPGGGAGCPKAALQLVRRKTRSVKLRAPLGRRAARWPRKLDRKRCKLARLLAAVALELGRGGVGPVGQRGKGQSPASRSICTAMMKSLRVRPPAACVVSENATRPQPSSMSG